MKTQMQLPKWQGYKWMGCISWHQAGCHIPAITTNRGAAIHPLMMQVSCYMVLGTPGTSNAGLLWQGLIWLVFIPPPNEVGGGVYWIHLVRPSVRLSVCLSVCRRHGFRSISQVCFGISISNFICMLMVAIGRSLLIFSDVTFKMATWRPYWIFWFLDSNFTLALNINFKLQQHNTYVYG